MRTADFDYDLPRELIATHPAHQRDESRLMVLHPVTGAIAHTHFRDVLSYLRPGDLLVMNDTRVIKARLRGTRPGTGGAVEALLLQPDATTTAPAGHSRWIALCRPAKKLPVGQQIHFAGGALTAQVIAEGPEGQRTLEFTTEDILPHLEQHGEIPLPPYIVQRRKETHEDPLTPEDLHRYQTVYAQHFGSVAAPTAGLHFTPALLQAAQQQGVALAWVTLHVGAGTFKPVEVEDPTAHPIHEEQYHVPPATVAAIQATKAAGGRIIAVGTTTVRTLESAWQSPELAPGPAPTRLLILPGYQFRVIDGLITNFHLPRSSLLMMISALSTRDVIMRAYHEAITHHYRFYSYGDAMLILPKSAPAPLPPA